MADENQNNQVPGEVGQSALADMKAWTPKVIGIIGSRRRKSKADYEQLEETLMAIYNEGDIIVSGGCPQGGDFFAEGLAKRLGATIIIHYPNWDKYGKAAGFERNGKIALDADVLLALVADDRKGGTEDTIRKYQDLEKGNLIILSMHPNPIPEEYRRPCTHNPTKTEGAIGMYHCPNCMMMVCAGIPHPHPDEINDPASEQTAEPKTTVVNIREPYDVYIGRRGHGQDGYFGNPHPVGHCSICGTDHDRFDAIQAFAKDFLNRIETDQIYRKKIIALKGKKLGCFCAPRACHGDVIASWLNQEM